MKRRPTINCERLRLRPFRRTDGGEVKRLVSERDVIGNLDDLPEPYEDGMAEAWIKTHHDKFVRGEEIVFAIVERESERLLGSIGLKVNKRNQNAELGYWVGKPYWGRGYASEAGRAVLRYAFAGLGLHRVCAGCFPDNPASVKVLEKLGMTREGYLRGHLRKRGRFRDVIIFGILRREFGK